MTYRVTAEREGGFWVITIPELDLVTQAHRIDQVEHMARDCIAAMLDVDYATVHVDVDVQVPAAWREEIAAVYRAQAEARRAQDRAAQESRRAARRLKAQGLTVRDVGSVLGVSAQRASQLLRSA